MLQVLRLPWPQSGTLHFLTAIETPLHAARLQSVTNVAAVGSHY